MREKYGISSPYEKLAESWELTLREGAVNRIANGEAAGMALSDYLNAVGRDAVSPDWDGEAFPLLIKLIDAADRLSVQVHPDDEYAAAHDGGCGKTEVWYVVDADPGASLICGLADGVTREDFAAAVGRGELSSVMREVPVSAGDCFFIPSGMLHAIGRGILIAEIQQNADLTYRVWDYDRRDADGNPRPLHIKAALDVVRPIPAEEVDAIRFSEGRGDGELLADCRYFSVRRLDLLGETELRAGDRFLSLLVLSGEGTLCCGGECYPVKAGESWFLPAETDPATLSGTLSALLSRAN